MAETRKEEMQKFIDDYATKLDGGLTYSKIREACGLQVKEQRLDSKDTPLKLALSPSAAEPPEGADARSQLAILDHQQPHMPTSEREEADALVALSLIHI